MKEIYDEFGIDIHSVPNNIQSQVNDLIREIVKLRNKNNINLKKLLNDCWEAADDYREQIDRINSGYSNFDKPTYPNKKEWIKNKSKEIS